MRKRLLKKYLKPFGLTLKRGKVACQKRTRRFREDTYLPMNHPLYVRRLKRYYREQARVLPALLKARINPKTKAAFARQVADAQLLAKDGDALPKLVWVERGARPRQRLLSSVAVYTDYIELKGKTDRQYLAAVDAKFSALLRRWPRIVGKRIQSGSRVKVRLGPGNACDQG